MFKRSLSATQLTIIVLPLLMIPVSAVSAGTLCPGIADKPRDYTNPQDHASGRIEIVERFHFSPDIEFHRIGLNGVQGNLNYTLNVIPNHHRALYSMAKLHWETDPTELYEVANEPWQLEMDCYFRRALRVNSQDPVVYGIQGIYRFKTGDVEGAEKSYLQALKLNPSYAEGHYNLALLYLEEERMSEAVSSAKKAYELGYPLPGLKHKLQAAGAWE